MKTMSVALCTLMVSAMPMVAQTKMQPKEATTVQTAAPKHKDSIEVISWSMRMVSKSGTSTSSVVSVKRETGSGMATGKRMHKPFVITKELDRTTPVLAAALASGETIASLEVTLDGASKDAAKMAGGAGKVCMQDLHITNIRKISPTMEEVTFDYGAMQVSTVDGKAMAADDWATSK